MTRRLLACFVLILAGNACGGNSSTPVAPSAPQQWTLSGTVKDAATSAAIGTATVRVLDGPNANRTATTGLDGQFQIGGLLPGGFTISVSATDYATMTQPVTLTANQAVSVALVKLLRAVLENLPGTVNGLLQPDGSYAFVLTAINSGTGCAGSVAGSTNVTATSGPITTIAWTLLPTSTIVRPGDKFSYNVCCLTRDQAFSPGLAYFTVFQFSTVPCA